MNTTAGFKPRATEEWLDLVLFRRIANRLVPVFIHAGVSPNRISTLSLFFGLASALLLIPHQFALSAIIAVLAIIVDCCDGQVARLTGQTSPMGRMLDGLVDLIWITAFWFILYNHTGYFQSHGLGDVFPLMFWASVSFVLHCWRYDGVKVKANELIYPDINRQDLDVHHAIKFMKESFHKRDVFNTVMAFCNVFHTFFFVRGLGQKQGVVMDHHKREQLKLIIEPVINLYSFLGVSHHNALMITATLLAPFTPYGYVAAFWFMVVPMNLWWIYSEYRHHLAKKRMQQILFSQE